MKTDIVNKIVLAFVVVVFSSCGSGGENKSLDSEAKNGNSKAYSYIPDTLETGETCYPVKINNRSKVLLSCAKTNGEYITAIWSEEDGIKLLPGELPQVFATSPSNLKLVLYPTDLSDNDKVLFGLNSDLNSQVSEYTVPPVSYIHDGEKYVTLPGLAVAMSPNGKYLATYVGSEFQIYKDLEKVELPNFSELGDIYEIRAINNNGIAVGTTYYSDIDHSYSSNFAVTLSKDGGRILPPPVRPDINTTSATDINSNGDILIIVNEVLQFGSSDSPEGVFSESRSRLYIVQKDGSFEEISPSPENYANYANSFNDNLVVAFYQYPIDSSYYLNNLYDIKTMIYRKDKGVSELRNSVDLYEGETFQSDTDEINNNNELIIYVNTSSGVKGRIAKLK